MKALEGRARQPHRKQCTAASIAGAAPSEQILHVGDTDGSPVKDQVHDLFADRVVSTSKVVGLGNR